MGFSRREYCSGVPSPSLEVGVSSGLSRVPRRFSWPRTLDHGPPLSASVSVSRSLAQPCPTLPSAPRLGFAPALLHLLLSSLTFSSASSLYFQRLLLTSHIFPDASLPLFSPVGATQGSFIPLLAQVPGIGLYIITFTVLLNDCKAFLSQPTQIQIYSNQDFMLTMEHTSY